MDLSKFNDADYEQLKKGNIQGMSDQGYQEYKTQYQQMRQAQTQAANPQQIPDAADKAAQGMRPDAKPVDPITQYNERHKNDSVGQKLMGMLSAPKDYPAVEGEAPMAFPAASLPSQALKLASFLGKNASLRVGTNTAVGAVRGAFNSPGDRMSGALKGGAIGLGLGLGSEAVSGAINSLGQTANTIKTATNPAATQDAAQEAIDTTSKALKSSEANTLQGQLGQHSVTIRPQEYMDLDPEVNNILTQHAKAQRPYGDVAGEINVPATDLNKIRSLLDQASRNTSGEGVVNPALSQKADQLRGMLHDLSPEIDQTYQDWSENLQGAKKFDKTNSPIAFLGSSSPDRQAIIQRAGEATNSNLSEISRQLQLARPVMGKPLGFDSVKSVLLESPAHGLKTSLFGNPENASVIDPRDLEAFSQGLQSKKQVAQ